MKRLEQLLDNLPMYRLVNISLCALIAVSFILSFFDVLSFSPLQLIATSIAFIEGGLIAHVVASKLFRLPAHLPSTFITVGILILLFRPSLDPVTLVTNAGIAAFAVASKYLLVYRKRHIFNPAAVAAVFSGLIFLDYASWWVASPPLTLPVIILAFCILYKQRELRTAGLFLLVSGGIIAARTVIDGSSITGAIVLALTSWPIVFFAGFMLSEPLTLPIKRWQKYLEAGVVGLIIALPFSIGDFSTSPALALLLGNVLAFLLAFKYRRSLRLHLKSKRELTPDLHEFLFESETPIRFDAGQYIELTLPHPKQDSRGVRRSFSIIPGSDNREIRVTMKVPANSSSFKRALGELPTNSVIRATGVYGEFTSPYDPASRSLLIAGGVGITPFISHIASASHPEKITVLYFVRSPEDAIYRKFLENSGADIHYFSGQNADHLFSQADQLTDTLLHDRVTNLSQQVAYVSGPPQMVRSVKKILKGKVSDIKTDYFSGY